MKLTKTHILIVLILSIVTFIRSYLVQSSVDGELPDYLIYCTYIGCDLKFLYQLPFLIAIGALFGYYIIKRHAYEYRPAILISIGFLVVNHFVIKLLQMLTDKVKLESLITDVPLSILVSIAAFYIGYPVVVWVLKTTGFYQEEV